jgi:hypothetical protein
MVQDVGLARITSESFTALADEGSAVAVMLGDPPVGPAGSDEGEDLGSSLDHVGRHRGDGEESIVFPFTFL